MTVVQLQEFKAAVIKLFMKAGLERERGKTNSGTAPNGASDHEGTFDDLELDIVIPMRDEGELTVRELLEKYGETGLEDARCCCSPWREDADAPDTGQVTVDSHTRGLIKIFDHSAKVMHMLSDAALKEWNDALDGKLVAAAMSAEKLPEQNRKALGVVNGLEGGNPIISGAAFVRDYVPPAYVVRGILQQRYLNSLTGQPGSGKTAVASLLAIAVALGRSELAGVDVYQGKVLYLAGENPDDTRMRFIALCHQHDIDQEQLQGKLDIFPGATRMTDEAARQIIEWAGETGPYRLVVVDTVAAYFAGDDEDKNKDAGDHARRLRGLTGIGGGPAILALAHPAKAARKPWEMVPRGGSAFTAEIDGNIYIVQEKGISTVGPTPKFRGARFDAITFDLVQINDNPVLIDDKGNQISSVIAAPVSADALEDRREQAMKNEDRLLLAIAKLPPCASLAEVAVEVGWYYKNKGKSIPNKTRVRRTLKRMPDAVEVIDGRYVFTPKGKRLLADLKEAVDRWGRGE